MVFSKKPVGNVAEYWNANARLWAEQVRRGWDVYREHFNNPAFFQFLDDITGKEVLDAGCGEGYNTRLMARSGAQMVGFDVSKEMIELAQKEEQREPLGIRYEVASFSALSLFEDASFDAVVSTMALMDGPDYEGAVAELFRVLRKGGELVFSITHPCFMSRGFGWIESEQSDGLQLTVSDYFDRGPWVERWKFSPAPEDIEPFAVPVFPRTLSDYINGLINAEFVLKAVEEPRPSPEACQEHPELQRWRDHAAVFFYVKAVKP